MTSNFLKTLLITAVIATTVIYTTNVSAEETVINSMSFNNFHEVEAAKLYRSAQMSARNLESTIKEYGIKTVINLRGHNPDQKWYKDEVAVTERTGVQLINISMNSKRLPHREDLLKLLEAYKNSPRPILIHCQAGADRTGEAAALYSMIYMNKTKDEALLDLRLKYLHLAKYKPAKSYFIRDVWKGVEWAETEYHPCNGEYKYYNTDTDLCKK